MLLCLAAKNTIQGTIPDAVRNMSSLNGLILDRNPMYGTLPMWLSAMQSLQYLGLSAFAGKHVMLLVLAALQQGR